MVRVVLVGRDGMGVVGALHRLVVGVQGILGLRGHRGVRDDRSFLGLRGVRRGREGSSLKLKLGNASRHGQLLFRLR